MMRNSCGDRAPLRAICGATALLVVLGLCSMAAAHEDPSADGLIDGGGSFKTDCVSRFQTGLELNYPVADPFDFTPKPPKELACVDGDVACDGDGQVNGSCTFNVGLCLIDDQDMDECTPAAVPAGGVAVKGSAALQSSVNALLGATGLPCDNPGAGGGNCMQCTSSLTPIVVSLAEKHGRTKLGVKVTTSPSTVTGKSIKDSDKLKLRCIGCTSGSAFEHINKIVFQQSCATSSCHGGNSPQGGLQLDSNLIGLQGVYDELITEDPSSPGAAAAGLRRILPGDPDLEGTSSSLLVEKLRMKPNLLNSTYCAPNSQPDGCVGGEMPPGVDVYSTGKLELIKNWVAAGAPIGGWPAGTGCGDPEDIYIPAEPLPPPPPGEGFQMHMPAPPGFFVEPGTEYEGCQWIAMPPEVTQTMYITRVEIRMNPGSHHMLAYQDIADGGPTATVTPFDPNDLACNKQFGVKRQFTGSQDPTFDQSLPDNIAMRLDPNQIFGINTHYTNPYNVPIFPEVWINFWGSTTPPAKEQKAIFPGDFDFSVPPYTEGYGAPGGGFGPNVFTYTGTPGNACTTNGDCTGGKVCHPTAHNCQIPACFFGFSSHSHRRNTGFKIWTSQPSTWDDTDGIIYDNPDWDHPLIYTPIPRLLFNPGDKLWFECRWDNGLRNPNDTTRRCHLPASPSCELLNDHVCFTNADCGPGTTGVCDDCPLDFGPLSEDEMCFVPGVYYDADPAPNRCPY